LVLTTYCQGEILLGSFVGLIARELYHKPFKYVNKTLLSPDISDSNIK
jgi:hypothetical protein